MTKAYRQGHVSLKFNLACCCLLPSQIISDFDVSYSTVGCRAHSRSLSINILYPCWLTQLSKAVTHHTWWVKVNVNVKASHTRCRSSARPGADPGVQAVSPQVTISHLSSGNLSLLSARPAVTFLAAKHHASWSEPSYTAWQRHIGVNNLP